MKQFSCSHLEKDMRRPNQSSWWLEDESAYLLVTRDGQGASTGLAVARRALDEAIKSQRTSLAVVPSCVVLTALQRKETG